MCKLKDSIKVWNEAEAKLVKRRIAWLLDLTTSTGSDYLIIDELNHLTGKLNFIDNTKPERLPMNRHLQVQAIYRWLDNYHNSKDKKVFMTLQETDDFYEMLTMIIIQECGTPYIGHTTTSLMLTLRVVEHYFDAEGFWAQDDLKDYKRPEGLSFNEIKDWRELNKLVKHPHYAQGGS